MTSKYYVVVCDPTVMGPSFVMVSSTYVASLTRISAKDTLARTWTTRALSELFLTVKFEWEFRNSEIKSENIGAVGRPFLKEVK